MPAREFVVQEPLLPPQTGDMVGKICLVLDLDETLSHTSLDMPRMPARYDFIFYADDGPRYVSVRPGAREFLAQLGGLFEIVIFTASLQTFADPVIDYLDERQVVRHRLYRSACDPFGGQYAKDLARLNRPIHRIMIVDNTPDCYIYQPHNAIPISSWFDDPSDVELVRLGRLLRSCWRLRNVYDFLVTG